MDELRKNNLIKIELQDGSMVQGSVLDLSYDRVLILVDEDSSEAASKISELQVIKVMAYTTFGIKTMNSSVISALDGRNCITIENAPTISTVQRREHVRAVDSFIFMIRMGDFSCLPLCLNVSGGGIAFNYQKDTFKVGQKVELIFNVDLFMKEIKCSAEIIKAHDDFYVAKYENLNQYDENKIVRRVFELLTKK